MKRFTVATIVFVLLCTLATNAWAGQPPTVPPPTTPQTLQQLLDAVTVLTSQVASLTAKIDALEALPTKVDALQTSVDDLKPPPPKTTTRMLFPFGSNQNGFDTGLAISNTGTESGVCTISFFGSGAPPPFTTPNIAPGTVYANTLITLAPGFQGYEMVECGFPLARGWGFLSDVGARNLAATIDAEILP
jgi:hypothetical protein